jgi:hypothetical protein
MDETRAAPMMRIMQHKTPLTIAAVRERLGVGETWIRKLDPVLMPIRDSSGRRLYDPDIVERVAAERAAR